MKIEYRHEEKFLINFGEYTYLKNILSKVMKKDRYMDGQEDYTVISLYFDTPAGKCYAEKQAGIKDRLKFRLRIYQTGSSQVRLEIKNRSDKGICKERAVISAADTERLIAGDADVLLAYAQPAAAKAYRLIKSEGFRPVVIVAYEREAYVLPALETRVTFDKRIRSSEKVTDFNQKDIFFRQISDRLDMVLEVKYNGAFPYFLKKILATAVARKQSVSKYCSCRRGTM